MAHSIFNLPKQCSLSDKVTMLNNGMKELGIHIEREATIKLSDPSIKVKLYYLKQPSDAEEVIEDERIILVVNSGLRTSVYLLTRFSFIPFESRDFLCTPKHEGDEACVFMFEDVDVAKWKAGEMAANDMRYNNAILSPEGHNYINKENEEEKARRVITGDYTETPTRVGFGGLSLLKTLAIYETDAETDNPVLFVSETINKATNDSLVGLYFAREIPEQDIEYR